jgi:hypothetical protein
MTNEEILREIALLPPEGQRLVEGFVAFLRQRYAPSQPVAQPPDSGLEGESFIGMWRDRDDMRDSSAWVRHIRRSEWGN